MASTTPTAPTLKTIDPAHGCAFKAPVKCINDGDDVSFFLGSKAYADIMTFLFQLNTSMVPRRRQNKDQGTESVKEWTLQDLDVPHPPVVQSIANLLDALTAVIDEAPPDTGPRRFGNVSFRKWHEIVQERIPALLTQHLPAEVLAFKSTSDAPVTAELEAYLIGSFGSAQRLDYGTGHELSFLAFLGCLWKLGAFPESVDGDQERGIVLGVIEPYLVLIRRLILTYTLEPAGSHGVWGLDDHSFAPYIFGSAQFSPPISNVAEVATEGSLPNAPDPAGVAKRDAVERERGRNMYFSAVGFIYDVKKGPFWEHSPILYDVSGVKAGWAKINKGMIKMYNVEVLSKFPVVQHFPFGSLFAWEKDPAAKQIQASVHTSSQPKSTSMTSPSAPTSRQPAPRDPLAAGGPAGMPMTAAPWAAARTGAPQGLRDPMAAGGPTGMPMTGMPMTGAPWAARGGAAMPAATAGPMETTKAPWAKRGDGAGSEGARGGPLPRR